MAVQEGATLSVETLESDKEKNIPSADQSHEYLALFEDKIYEDYKGILEAASKHKVLEEIKWCSRKGFYQQALTLIEARMPRELKECGVYRYDSRLFDYVNNCVKSKRYDYQDPVDFIFYRTISTTTDNTSIAKKFRMNYKKLDGSKGTISEQIECYHKYYINERLYEKYLKNIDLNDEEEDVAKKFFESAKFKKVNGAEHLAYKLCSVMFTYDEDVLHELFAFIHLHAAFKNLRNQANHASQDSIDISLEKIDNALSFYCEHGKNIETYAEEKSSNQNLSH